MKKRLLVLGVAWVGACQIADPNPSPTPAGESAGTSPAGASSAGSGGSDNGGGHGGTHEGTVVQAGAGGAPDEQGQGGGAGDPAAPTPGGAGGEAGGPGNGDGCTPACAATQTCVTHACIDQDCAPEANFCSGSSLRTCAEDGLSSVEVMPCGQGKYCDPSSKSCKSGFTSCSNIYLGSGRFGANPQPLSQANDAIELLDYEVKVNTVIFGQVHVKNLGTDDSPSTHLELYLSEAPGFATNQNRLIFETNAVVPGAAVGGDIGDYTVPWSFTFSTVGHYVLLARVENNSPPSGASCVQQAYDLSSPTTDGRTAVHYLNVVE